MKDREEKMTAAKSSGGPTDVGQKKVKRQDGRRSIPFRIAESKMTVQHTSQNLSGGDRRKPVRKLGLKCIPEGHFTMEAIIALKDIINEDQTTAPATRVLLKIHSHTQRIQRKATEFRTVQSQKPSGRVSGARPRTTGFDALRAASAVPH